MTNDYSYAKEKLYEALHALVGSSPIEQRLTFAAGALILLQPDQIPPQIAQDLRAALDVLTKTPLSDSHSYTPRPVTPEEGVELAHKILSMFVDLMGGL